MTSLHHIRAGRGDPPLVFIHAFGCDHTDWDAQIAQFSRRHEVVAVDLGGHGGTPARPEHARVETHADDVVNLLVALDLGPAVVIGNSLGCRIAMEVAARAPDQTRAVVLVDGSRLSPVGSGIHGALGGGASAERYREAMAQMFAQMFSPGFDPARKAAMTDRAVGVPAEVGAALLADIGRHDLEEMVGLLERIRVPVLAIQSTFITADGKRHMLSRGQTSPYLDLLREKIQRLSIKIVEASGHYPQVERPAETNAALKRFLSRTSSDQIGSFRGAEPPLASPFFS